ncbi:hypothetical protein CDEF62S_01762 [Castellaniella defragrans]
MRGSLHFQASGWRVPPGHWATAFLVESNVKRGGARIVGEGSMGDLIYVVLMVAAFALITGFLLGLEKI